MKQKAAKILMIFLLIFLANCTQDSDKNNNQILINNGKQIISLDVQIADDNEERARGLMLIENLNENTGMFFVFEQEDYRTFWMKNTLIPLDIIFINDNMEITDIKSAVPCKQDPCALYSSGGPSKYVLEVNAGFAAKEGINEGDTITMKPENQ